MEIRVIQRPSVAAGALVSLGIAARLLPHPANLAPIGAIALFGGAALGRRSWWVPVVAMAGSDIFLGMYRSMPFTWLGFLLVGYIGLLLRRWHSWIRIPLGAIAGSLTFFVVSNFGVWLAGGLYDHSWRGLAQCFTLALPFLRPTIVGDLLYSTLFFGLYAVATRPARVHTAATQASQ